MFVLLMTMTLAMLFAALVSYGTNQTRHAEMLRMLEFSSQSILHTYDRQLLESYSLLAVDLEFVEPSAYLTSYSGPVLRLKRPGRTWTLKPLRTLDEPAHFLEAVRRAAAVGVADEILDRFTEGLVGAPKAAADGGVPAGAFISGAAFEDELIEAGTEASDEEKDEATKAKRVMATKAIQWIRQINALKEVGDAQTAREKDTDAESEVDAGSEAEDDLDQDAFKTLEPEVKAKLPSHVYKGAESGLSPADRAPFVFYAARHFRDRVDDHRQTFYGAAPPTSYFDAELEYILYGHDAESFNTARAYADVFLIRLTGNLAHVLACSEKLAVIEAASGAVNAVVGIPAPITASALVLTWGMAESRSDLARLLNGESLPWVHVTEGEWRTGFGAATHKAAANGVAHSNRDDPAWADYGDHLAALLTAKASTNQVLHAMDLISLGNGERGTSLSQRATKFQIRVEASGGLPEVVWEDGYGLD